MTFMWLRLFLIVLCLLYISALLLIVLLLKEEFKHHVTNIMNKTSEKYQGLRHSYIAYNETIYNELYNHKNFTATYKNYSTISSIPMPWQTGIWPKKNSSSKVLSLKSVSLYANTIQWNRKGRNFDDIKRKVKRNFKKRILHIINPFATYDARLEETQNMTMASIEVARAWIEYTNPSLSVDILTVEIDDSNLPPLRPKTFFKYPFLIPYYQNGSVLQPQLKNILRAGLNTGLSLKYDIIVYSNMDINTLPHFYAIVDKMSDCYETFFINRVEIPDRIVKDMAVLNTTSFVAPKINNIEDIYTDIYININTMEEAYKYALKFHQLHPGYDCMITTPQSLVKIIDNIGEVFVGHPPVGSVLAKAAAVIDPSCITARGVPATFHVGSRNGHWEDKNETLNDLNGFLSTQSNALKKKSQKPCKPYSMMKSRKKKNCYPDIYPDEPLKRKFKLPEDYLVKVK